MARSFNGTNQAIQSSATVNLSGTSVITLSFWLWWNAFANDDELAMETSANYNSNNGAILIDPNSSTHAGSFDWNIHTAAGFTAGHTARPSAAAWHHYAAIMNTSAQPQVWIDGVSQSVSNDGTNGTGNFGNFTLNLMSRNSTTLWAAGRMSDFAIFQRALDVSEILALAGQQITPLSLRNGALAVYYQPGAQTPIQDLSENKNFGSLTGVPVVVDDPPTIRRKPRKAFAAFAPAVRTYAYYITLERLF